MGPGANGDEMPDLPRSGARLRDGSRGTERQSRDSQPLALLRPTKGPLAPLEPVPRILPRPRSSLPLPLRRSPRQASGFPGMGRGASTGRAPQEGGSGTSPARQLPPVETRLGLWPGSGSPWQQMSSSSSRSRRGGESLWEMQPTREPEDSGKCSSLSLSEGQGRW